MFLLIYRTNKYTLQITIPKSLIRLFCLIILFPSYLKLTNFFKYPFTWYLNSFNSFVLILIVIIIIIPKIIHFFQLKENFKLLENFPLPEAIVTLNLDYFNFNFVFELIKYFNFIEHLFIIITFLVRKITTFKAIIVKAEIITIYECFTQVHSLLHLFIIYIN